MDIIFIYSVSILIPALIPIYFIYKQTKNCDKKRKDIINMISVAFFIPFMNFIFLRYTLIQSNLSLSLFPYLIGFAWLCFMLPILFIITLSIPQKEFPYKKWSLATILLTELMGCLLIFISSLLDTAIIIINLEEARPTINYIKDYRKQNEIYPKNINEHQPKLKKFPEYKYTLLDNGKEFKLTVSGNENYNYCSSSKFEGCNTKSTPPTIRNKVGVWIEEYENFD